MNVNRDHIACRNVKQMQLIENLVRHMNNYYCRKSCKTYLQRGSCFGCGYESDLEEAKVFLRAQGRRE